jgi:DNA gyrase subunit B
VSFVQHLNKNKTVVNDKPIFMKGEKDGIDAEIALQWNDGYSELIFSFANNINTHEGGTHLPARQADPHDQRVRRTTCQGSQGRPLETISAKA